MYLTGRTATALSWFRITSHSFFSALEMSVWVRGGQISFASMFCARNGCDFPLLSFFCDRLTKIIAFSWKSANKLLTLFWLFNGIHPLPPPHLTSPHRPSFPSQCLVSCCLDKHLTTMSSRPDNQWQMPAAKSNYFCLMCSWGMEVLGGRKKSKSKTVFFFRVTCLLNTLLFSSPLFFFCFFLLFLKM